MILFSHKKIVDPPFCPLSTCPIRYLSRILQQFSSGPLLLVQPIFSKPHWGLWLRDLSYDSWQPQFRLRPIQAPQAYLGTLGPLGTTIGPLRHLRSTQAPEARLGPLGATIGPLRSPFRQFLHVSMIGIDCIFCMTCMACTTNLL